MSMRVLQIPALEDSEPSTDTSAAKQKPKAKAAPPAAESEEDSFAGTVADTVVVMFTDLLSDH
jgi:hypothetical protein